ncbi:MAG TPA: PSD1 and planctomycete cytochrome C domain-containing protein, partial [Pirellulales bacterium]|nr:PSD1 and planctomycete cytochrome C domain-containing protein [Pirellulales bacterium]
CHSAQAKIVQSGLRLDSAAGLARGGDNGAVVVAGEPDRSRLIEALRYTNADLQMPPEGQLSLGQITDFETWVRLGAPYPPGPEPSVLADRAADAAKRKLWSIQPVVAPLLPETRPGEETQSPVDRFVVARLKTAGLEPAPPADRRALLRRATFDLTGLPPTPDELDDFLTDARPDAFERVVERLLASLRYGERWGQHWLDVVRYSDTAGCNSDYPIPEAHKYRDYVIESFNDDVPYDRFVCEQIAGDLLPCSDERQRRQQIVATGYLAISRRYGSSDPEFHLTIEDTIDNVGKAILGLSISCARCHDHKFDPLTARDYYGLYGIFESTRYAFPGMEDFPHRRGFVALAGDAARREHFDYQATVSGLDHQVFELKSELKALRRTAEAAPINAAEYASRRTIEQVQAEYHAATKRLAELLRGAPPVDSAYAVWEGNPADAQIQIKGDPQRSGDHVPRGFPAVLGGQTLSDPGSGSGRLELARWLTEPTNPLTARVFVNRLWQHHFGRGLVATPNDFGFRGAGPTHPELLDWLAARFMSDGWSIKSMHRLLMLSNTYRQSSDVSAAAAKLGSDDGLFSRFYRGRLDAEELRDAMLAVSGSLDLTMGGAHPFPAPGKIRYTQHKPFSAAYESNRRSVYLMRQRRQAHPYLDLFDAADPKVTTPLRPESTTSLQALFMMNSGLVDAQAEKLCQRSAQFADDQDRIRHLYRLLFARWPSGMEVEEARSFLAECRQRLTVAGFGPARVSPAAWTSYCRVLLASNEFVFID